MESGNGSSFVLVRKKEHMGVIKLDDQVVYSWMMIKTPDNLFYFRLYEGLTFASNKVKKITPRYKTPNPKQLLGYVRVWLNQEVHFYDMV